jgi:ATP-dependent Clp protease ATP-binding subunit ClpC
MYLDTHGHDGDEAQKERTMFERFTDQARRVLALAQEEARAHNCHRVGTEHLLLGLIQEREGIALAALSSLGISPEMVRRQVAEITGQRQGQEPPGRHTQYTMRAKKALDLALREALQLGHHHIGTEHILLSLIREGEGPAAQALLELGADLSLVRQQVLLLLSEDNGEQEPQAGPAAPLPSPAGGGEGRLLAELLGRIEDLDSRLSAVEQRMGTGPDVQDLDQQIARVRRDKESAVTAEEYETAAALRNAERQLLADKASRQKEWAAAHLDLPAVADKLHRLVDEVGRLRGLLRQMGVEPQGGAA